MRVSRESRVKDEAQNTGMGAGVECSCWQDKGVGGYISLFLGEVNQRIFSWGK